MNNRKELHNIVFLRGIASLMVCIFHLLCGNEALFPAGSIVKSIFSYGYLGVEVFFIVSGFIICYSLPRDYSIKDFKPFITKRLWRIHPPYTVCILLVLTLNTISYSLTGTLNPFRLKDVIGDFFYLNNFGFGKSLNVVFWTLGIEFQFYIIIGMLYQVLQRMSSLLLFVSVLILTNGVFFNSATPTIVNYLSIFSIGILAYFYYVKKELNTLLFVLMTSLCLAETFYFHHYPAVLASIFSLLTIHFWHYSSQTLKFLSNISFSLYLIHVPVGGKVVNLGLRFVDTELQRYMLFLFALIVSIVSAYHFYRIIETPFIKLSKKITYTCE